MTPHDRWLEPDDDDDDEELEDCMPDMRDPGEPNDYPEPDL